MTFPIDISTSSAGNSPMSDDSSLPPRTPTSPSMQALPMAASPESSSAASAPATTAGAGAAQVKRKPSRRANTAERRATHNAVERARRETLNGRFLDLAALLPNLSQIRRPSKSSIVNSSIAHIHASRRHRLLASRELRLVKMEADALRRELNEWRDRAALPRVEEPIRGEGFAMVLAGELEVITAVQEEDEDNDDYADDDFPTSSLAPPPPAQEQQSHFPALAAAKAAAAGHPFASNGSSSASLPPLNMAAGAAMGSRPVSHAGPGPMIASSPTAINFENPVMPALYEPSHATGPFAPFISQAQAMPDVDKVAAWNAHMFSAQQAQLAAQRSLLTPPGSSNGMPNAVTAASAFPDASQAFFANFQRHQAQMAGAYADMEDAAAAAAAAVREHRAHIGRERRGSGSGYGSPSEASSYEMPSAISDYATGRRGLHVGTNFDPLTMGMMKQGLASPTATGRVGGGGGNAHGYMMMM